MVKLSLPLENRSDLSAWYDRIRSAYEKVLFQMQRELSDLLDTHGIHPTIKYRLKSFSSLYDKACRRVRAGEVEGESLAITDLIGIRVVCPFIEDIRHVETLLNEHFSVLEREQKGAEYSFHEFGYESVHYLVSIPKYLTEGFNLNGSVVCEVQLRTILQDAWAEVEHELVYKAEFTPFDEPLRRKLAALNANLSLSDIVFQEIRDYQRQLHLQLKRRRRSFWSTVDEVTQDDVRTADAVGAEPSAPPEPAAPSAEPSAAPPDEGVGSPAETPASGMRDIPEEIATSMIPGGDTIDNLLLRALNAHNREDFRQAISLYTRILEQGAKRQVRSVIHIHRGMAYFASRDYDEALADFTRALEQDLDNPKGYYYRALVYRVNGDIEAALSDFDECLKRDPFQYDPLLSRSRLYLHLGEVESALQDCDAALSIHPDSQRATQLRSRILQKLNL